MGQPQAQILRLELLTGVLALVAILLAIVLAGVLAKMPIVCTFGRLLGQPATLPEEGLCDYAFYEFHYQPYGSPNFLNPNHLLLQRYMNATRRRRKTQYGLGFTPFDLGDFQYQLTVVDVNSLIKIFWDARIYHYGMLTVAHVTTVSDLTLILNILQTLKHLATVNGQGIPKTLTVLGLTVFSDQDFNSAATTITIDIRTYAMLSRFQLCTMKGNYTKLHYGLAVYDVDHDDLANNCIGQSRYEGYSRLKMINKLNEFFRSYLTAADEENCLRMY
ncbi:hypothetical protein MRX96_026608 [Rhipicephalus microplus]